MTISFNTLQSWFPDEWDVGIISAEYLRQASLRPIKHKFDHRGLDITNGIHFPPLYNSLVLARDGHAWDYTLFQEAEMILKKNGYTKFTQVYTNYKEVMILAGLGVRARNSLVYNYKFGFDCHIAVIMILEEVVDLPTHTRVNENMWHRCKDCDDCRKACPVGAIHNDVKHPWIDSTACDDFLSSSDHPTIPSIKKFWLDKVHPEFPKDVAKKLNTTSKVMDYFNGKLFPFDKNGYTHDGNVARHKGAPISVPSCRECTSQPRCSKWEGKYPYDDVAEQLDVKPLHFIRKPKC